MITPELAQRADKHVICYWLDPPAETDAPGAWHEMTSFNNLDKAKQSFVKLIRIQGKARYALFTISYHTVAEYIPEG